MLFWNELQLISLLYVFTNFLFKITLSFAANKSFNTLSVSPSVIQPEHTQGEARDLLNICHVAVALVTLWADMNMVLFWLGSCHVTCKAAMWKIISLFFHLKCEWFLCFCPLKFTDANRPDDGRCKRIWNVSKPLPDYAAWQARRQPLQTPVIPIRLPFPTALRDIAWNLATLMQGTICTQLLSYSINLQFCINCCSCVTSPSIIKWLWKMSKNGCGTKQWWFILR